MNIQILHDILSHMGEIKVIGKSAKIGGVACNVMGIIRRGMKMRLLILQYDESFQQRIEEIEAETLYDTP